MNLPETFYTIKDDRTQGITTVTCDRCDAAIVAFDDWQGIPTVTQIQREIDFHHEEHHA